MARSPDDPQSRRRPTPDHHTPYPGRYELKPAHFGPGSTFHPPVAPPNCLQRHSRQRAHTRHGDGDVNRMCERVTRDLTLKGHVVGTTSQLP